MSPQSGLNPGHFTVETETGSSFSNVNYTEGRIVPRIGGNVPGTILGLCSDMMIV